MRAGDADRVLGNVLAVPLRCTDANLDAITLEAVTHPVAGTLALIDQSAGSVFYTPFAGFAGQDSFTYRGVGRGVGGAAAGVVVNVAGVAAQAVDADSDGAPAGADCNDGNARIRPGAREIPGNAVDENCDNRRALGRLGTVSNKWSSFVDHTEVTRLRMTGTPAGATRPDPLHRRRLLVPAQERAPPRPRDRLPERR